MGLITEHISFSENWNGGKCNNTCFTTIRLWNERKYFVGARFQMYLKKRFKAKVEIIDIKKIKLDQINDWMARLDTGLSAQTTKDLIKKMYSNQTQIMWNTQDLAYILFKKIDNNDHSDIFK